MKREPRLILVRHADTAWTVTGQYTGRTDLPLTPNGRATARALGPRLAPLAPNARTSPLRRAAETCRLAGFACAPTDDRLIEWDYGRIEGLTPAEVADANPRWSLWSDGAPGGETPSDVARRIDIVLNEFHGSSRDTILFSHGHILRGLAARWIGLPIAYGRCLRLAPGAISVLTRHRGDRVIDTWNHRNTLTHDG